MNNKILLGSIIAVVILVLVSFTGVVGYQTTKSSNVSRASPLFSIRTQRAIDEDSRDLTCDYVGRGEVSGLSVPKRNDKTALERKVMDMICVMDDKVMNFVLKKLQQKDGFKDVNINEVITVIQQLKNNPERIYFDYENNYGDYTYWETPTLCWWPTCLLGLIFVTIFEFIWVSLIFLYGWITSRTCMPYPAPCSTTDCAI